MTSTVTVDEQAEVAEQEQQVEVAEEQAQAEPTAEEAKKPKTSKDPHACLCSLFEVGMFDETEGTPDEQVYNTDCSATTKRTFAQGHDARLVSFLVDGHFDGYSIRMVQDGVATTFATPEDAARVASEELAAKALKATERRNEKEQVKRDRIEAKAKATEAKEKEKAEKAAAKEKAAQEAAEAKAKAPKATGAEVVAGTKEGDQPDLPEGLVRIKVGRWEYEAEIDDDGVATYLDGKGDEQRMERDGYRLLTPAN